MTLSRMNVTTDDNFTVSAWVDPDVRWNGFVCPVFDRDAAGQVAEWLNATADAEPEPNELTRARWDGDTLVIVYHDDVKSYEERVSPDDHGRYAIGSASWTWDAADKDAWNELHAPRR